MDFEHLLWIFLISALPIVELRLAIPLGILYYDQPWAAVLVASLLGNLLPVPFLLLFLDYTVRILRKVGPLRRVIDWVFERTRKRGTIVEKYKRVGLVLLVAIPLPGTGAWTGSVAASIFGVEFRRALISITIGVLIAGLLVTALSILGLLGAGDLPAYLRGE